MSFLPARELPTKPQIIAMRWLQEVLDLRDKAVSELLAQGTPIVRAAMHSAFYKPKEGVIPPEMTFEQFLLSTLARRQKVMNAVRRKGQKGGPEIAAIYSKTVAERDDGTMQGPFSLQQIQEEFGPKWNCCPTFALDQCQTAQGGTEWRVCVCVGCILLLLAARNNPSIARSLLPDKSMIYAYINLYTSIHAVQALRRPVLVLVTCACALPLFLGFGPYA